MAPTFDELLNSEKLLHSNRKDLTYQQSGDSWRRTKLQLCCNLFQRDMHKYKKLDVGKESYHIAIDPRSLSGTENCTKYHIKLGINVKK